MKSKPKVLVVTYYWYPFAGVGSYRVSRFVKYLQKMGWEVVILTAQKASSSQLSEPDHPLLDTLKVYRTPIIEPTQWLSPRTHEIGKSQSITHNPGIFYSKNKSLISRIAVWLRRNWLIPDAKLSWKWFAVPAGKKIIRREKPDVIFSTSPPPTTHRIAESLAKWSGLAWHADFRDPWTNIYYYDDFPLGARADKKNRAMEANVLENAPSISVVNHGFFSELSTDQTAKIRRITNGYDPDHIQPEIINSPKNEKFTIRYFGSLKINQRPSSFIDALRKLEAEQPGVAEQVRFEFYGSLDATLSQEFSSGLARIEFKPLGFIKHDEMLKLLPKSDLLLLSIGQTKNSFYALSTKVFEYMVSGTKVLGIGPTKGAAAELVRHTNIGSFYEREDAEGVFAFLINEFKAYKKNKSQKNSLGEAAQKYSFESLTTDLDSQLRALIP